MVALMDECIPPSHDRAMVEGTMLMREQRSGAGIVAMPSARAAKSSKWASVQGPHGGAQQLVEAARSEARQPRAVSVSAAARW